MSANGLDLFYPANNVEVLVTDYTERIQIRKGNTLKYKCQGDLKFQEDSSGTNNTFEVLCNSTKNFFTQCLP